MNIQLQQMKPANAEREGRFPTRVQLSERTFGWVESEVQEWINDRVRERNSNLRIAA